MNDGALPERKCWRCGATDMFNLAFNGLCVRCAEVARAHVRFGIEKPAEAEHKSTPGGLRPQLPTEAEPYKPMALRVQQWGLFYRDARPFIRTGLALLLMMRRNPAFAKDSYALADIFLAELEKDLAVWEGTRTWAGKVSTEKHDGG